ncbi:MAG: energy-coupling factor transporter ATPase [Ktedonobacteraceae bacterium]
MTGPIIITQNLCHTYRSGPLVKLALVDINMEIARGSCAAIIGVTGSGKSTLVQHFNGLLRPTSGTVIVDGIDVSARGADLQALRRRVGMLFQFPETQLFENSVYADVAFGPRRMKLSKREVRTRVLKALETVGLPPHDFAQRSPFELSGGQMRRVALAGVLAMSPTILVLDEPTTGLDADARGEFYYYLRRAQQEQGVTIVLVSHDMTEVATLANRLYVLNNGRLVMQGTPRTVFAQGDALRTWGLAEPPLSELLALLRKQGLAIPAGILTLDEAFAALQDLSIISGSRLQVHQEK